MKSIKILNILITILLTIPTYHALAAGVGGGAQRHVPAVAHVPALGSFRIKVNAKSEIHYVSVANFAELQNYIRNNFHIVAPHISVLPPRPGANFADAKKCLLENGSLGLL